MEQQLALPGVEPRPLTIGLGPIVREDCDDDGEAMEALEAAGWNEVGDGCYSCVFISPCGTRAIKFCDGEGQEATLQAALENQHNPHFPRIFGVRYDVGGYDFVVECEALQLCEKPDDFDWGDERTYPPDYQAWSRRWDPTTWKRVKFGPNGPMKDALKALRAAADDYGVDWDAHCENLMIRPSTGELVLNDLLA